MGAYPILVLQNNGPEGLGRFEPALARLGMKARIVEAWNGERIPSTISGHQALVVLGGPQAAYNAPHVPYLDAELRAIREAAATRTPVLGVCLGSQLVAHALGGRAKKGPAGPEIGMSTLAWTPEGRADKLLRHVPVDLPVAHWHSDTFDLPPGATLLASTARYPQAFALPNDVYGLQFHLEWSRDTLAAIAREDPEALATAGLPLDRLLADLDRASARLQETAERVFETFLTECGCND